jgi:hypothetical protein
VLFRSVFQTANERRRITSITDPYQDETITSALIEDGFRPIGKSSIKLSLPVAMKAKELSEHLLTWGLPNVGAKNLCDQLGSTLSDPVVIAKAETISEIERLLWPAKIVDPYIPTFLVPIKPEWAKELFDENLGGQTLFGAKQELGLSREGVYYRSRLLRRESRRRRVSYGM